MPEKETPENKSPENLSPTRGAFLARERHYAELEAETPRLGEVEFYQRSRRSILVGGLAALAGFSVFSLSTNR